MGAVGRTPMVVSSVQLGFLLGYGDCEGVDYDVRGDMKGLGADVERRCMPDCVEYVVSPRQEPPRQIVLKIGIALYNSVFAEESKGL